MTRIISRILAGLEPRFTELEPTIVTAPPGQIRRRLDEPVPTDEEGVSGRVGHQTPDGWCRIPATLPHVDCEVSS